MTIYKYFCRKYKFVLPTVHTCGDLSRYKRAQRSTRLTTVYACIVPSRACCMVTSSVSATWHGSQTTKLKNHQCQKTDILGHFAQFNARQIFPLYSMLLIANTIVAENDVHLYVLICTFFSQAYCELIKNCTASGTVLVSQMAVETWWLRRFSPAFPHLFKMAINGTFPIISSHQSLWLCGKPWQWANSRESRCRNAPKCCLTKVLHDFITCSWSRHAGRRSASKPRSSHQWRFRKQFRTGGWLAL